MTTGGGSLTFDKIEPKDYEKWYQTKEGLYFDKLEKELIAEMVKPKTGESLLEIGCGTAHFLRWFRTFGLELAGVDSSRRMIEFASSFLDRNAVSLKVANAENLPFQDKTFDIVVFITTLEFIENPRLALKEALRVTKKKIFIGFLNKFSLLALKYKIKGLSKNSSYNKAKFYSIFTIKNMVRDIDKNLKIKVSGINTTWGNIFSPFNGVLIEK